MSDDKSFSDLMNGSCDFETPKKGSVVSAIVVNLKRGKVELDVGYKGLGTIDRSEFNEDLSIGDVVNVYVEDIDDGIGNIVLSKSKELLLSTMENLQKTIKNGETVQMVVDSVSRGGISGNYNGIYTFLPFSIVDVSPQKNTETMKLIEHQLKDRRNKVLLDVKVISSNNKNKKSVIVSRKAVIEENKTDRVKISDLKEDQVVKGVVKNITSYGAFIDLGGVDGLLHISDVSWVNVEENIKKLKVGSTIDVMILSVFEDKGQVALSLKDIDRKPWFDFNKNHQNGQIVKARVNNIGLLGFFATILDSDGNSVGIDGFVRNSEVEWKNKNPELGDFVEVGDIVDLQIIEIDQRKERISLSLKRTKDNLLQDFLDKNGCGSIHKLNVESKVNYGFKVVTNCGVRGFLSPTEVSWNYADRFNKDVTLTDTFDAVLIDCDPIKEKVVFSIKRLVENPAIAKLAELKDSKFEARVVEIANKYVLVEIDDGIFGYVKNANSRVQVGDILKVKAIDVTNYDYAIINVEIT